MVISGKQFKPKNANSEPSFKGEMQILKPAFKGEMQILKPAFKGEMQILKPALKGEQQELDTKEEKKCADGSVHVCLVFILESVSYVWFLFWKVSRLIKKGIGLASHMHP